MNQFRIGTKTKMKQKQLRLKNTISQTKHHTLHSSSAADAKARGLAGLVEATQILGCWSAWSSSSCKVQRTKLAAESQHVIWQTIVIKQLFPTETH